MLKDYTTLHGSFAEAAKELRRALQADPDLAEAQGSPTGWVDGAELASTGGVCVHDTPIALARFAFSMLIASLLGLLPVTAPAAAVSWPFESDDDAVGWTVGGAGAVLQITHEATQVREGRGALLCSYTGAPGSPFSLSAGNLELAGVRSLSCSLRASAQAPLVLILTEQDGSIYHTFVTCPSEEWCDVALSLSDFQLQDGSQDENAALDADQIGSFTVQELANMPGGLGEVFGTKTGPQTLAVDRLSFAAQDVPRPAAAERGRIVVDDFSGPWLRLLPVGGAELSRVPGADGGAPSALCVRFTFAPAGPAAWPGVVLPVGTFDLTGARAWRLRAQSAGGLKLTTVLEEWDGSKYEATVTLPNADWRAVDVPLSDLKLDPSTTDENGALDLGQVRVAVIVADALNMLLDENEQGAYALDDVVFLTN